MWFIIMLQVLPCVFKCPFGDINVSLFNFSINKKLNAFDNRFSCSFLFMEKKGTETYLVIKNVL